MEILKCPSCGAHINIKTSKCEYCGTSFKNSEKQEEPKVVNANTEQAYLEPLIEPVQNELPSMLSIIFGFIIFWPIGLYLLLKRIAKSANTFLK